MVLMDLLATFGSLLFSYDTREANGEKLQFNVLISHAQDYLMTTYTLKDIVAEIVNLYKLLK